MKRFALVLFCLLGVLSTVARGGTYTLIDGSQISGEPISYNEDGVKLKTGPETFLERTPWSKFTQESLRQLRNDAKTPQDRAILDPMIEDLASEKAKRKSIDVKPVQPPERPTRQDGRLGIFAIFSSPLGWAILGILYAANLFAAYEVAIFRHQPFHMVGGLAAVPFIGIASPIIFLALPNRIDLTPEQSAPAGPVAEGTEPSPGGPMAGSGVTGVSSAGDYTPNTSGVYSRQKVAEAPAQDVSQGRASLPEPTVFRRGDFSFNRRFFETKLAGFFRLVPAEAEKDLVVQIQSSRGDFVGKRITRVTPNELYLQVFKNDATADEMIPYVEVNEVQIRHKDLA